MGTKIDTALAGPSGLWRKPTKKIAKVSLEGQMIHDSAYAQKALAKGKVTKQEYNKWASKYRSAYKQETSRIDRLFYGHASAGKSDKFYKGVLNVTGNKS